MDRSSKQKINKETQVLNDTLDEMGLINIFRTFHPNAEEYTFSSAHWTLSRIDHILSHKSNLSKFKKIEIVSSIFFDHNAIRLDIISKRKGVRNTNTWRLYTMFLNNEQVTEEIKSESESRSVVSNSLWPHGLYSPWNSSGQNTGVGSLFLLQVILPTQGSNPRLPHYRQSFTGWDTREDQRKKPKGK